MEVPSREVFLRGVQEYERRESRDAMYRVATFLVRHFWGKPSEMADALGVLLLTWNQAFYRYGSFDFDHLESCIARNMVGLAGFRRREICSFSSRDRGMVGELFNDFLGALEISTGKARGRRSPVAAAKALHLLAPRFFPIWDARIARTYKCYYHTRPAAKYIEFCEKVRAVADEVKNYIRLSDKTVVKLIDQYNYSKYTKGWV